MNDEFLYRLRKDPPPRFAARLKARLDLRASPSLPASRSFLNRALVAAFLIGGSALAIALFVPREMPSVAIEPVRERQNSPSAPVTATQPDFAAAHRSPISQGRVEDPAAAALEQLQSQPAMLGEAQPARIGLIIVSSATTDALTKLLVDEFSPVHGFQKPRIENVHATSVIPSFCNGIGNELPDIAIAARRITTAEFDICRSKGVRIVEVKLGYQALVLTGAVMGSPLKLSVRDVYNALAKQVPDPLDPKKLIDNPNRIWSQVNAELEARRIEVLGPPRGSLMQEAFAALVLEAGCDTYGWIKALKDIDRKRYDRICHTLREDGAYVEVVEATDTLVTQRLWAEPSALAILDYAFYRRHSSNLLGSLIEQAAPTFESISTGTYPASRPLYLYVNAVSARRRAGIAKFLEPALSEYTLSRLARKGILAPDEAQWRAIRTDAMQFKELDL